MSAIQGAATPAGEAARSAPAEGLLLVDKPGGITSHDVVQIARRAYGQRSIGHLGTLDPFATGLLILLLGRFTRLATFVETEPKVYEATVKFGAETDTDDCTGAVLRESGVPAMESIREAMSRLVGRIEQVPPAYSAKSVGGVRAHEAARLGSPLDLAPVLVDVFDWKILAERGPDSKGPQARRVTILFLDIRGFTALSERLAPAEVVALLNEFFSLLTDVAFEYDGTIFSMAGDSLLIGFGVPVEQADGSQRAIAAARQMLLRFGELAGRWKVSHDIETGLGIGINVGEVIAGNIRK